MEKILAIDFDGTIVTHEFPKIGTPIPHAKEVINRLFDEQYYIIIWSCRGSFNLIEAYIYLKENGIKFHKFNENAPIDLTGFHPHPKIYANIYIDDANLGGLPEWREIYKIITNKEYEVEL